MTKTDDIASFENDILRVIRDVLASVTHLLNDINITTEVLDLRRSGQGSRDYDCEATIYFWDALCLSQGRRNLVDVIEFHLVRQGKPQASVIEIEGWFRDTVDDVIKRRRAKLPPSPPEVGEELGSDSIKLEAWRNEP